MMARLTDEQWELARIDYEIHGLSWAELVTKYNTSDGAIARRSKKDNWQKGKAEQLLTEKVSAIKALKEVEQKAEQFTPIEKLAINNEVDRRLEIENIITNDALKGQKLASKQIDELDSVDELTLMDLKTFSQITATNKETLLGKQPDTAIQVNNNVSTISDKDEFMQIAAEVLAKV